MKWNERIILRKGVPPEAKEEVEGYLERFRGSMEEPFEGEPEKSEEETKFIIKVGKYIAEELSRLGLSPATEIAPERFHILPSGVYERYLPDDAWPCGFYESDYAGAIIRGDMPRLNIFKTVAHEATHMASYHAHEIIKVPEKEKSRLGEYRVGYLLSPSNRFLHFNEGITDLITQELLSTHRAELEKKFAVTEKEAVAAPVAYYNFEMDLVKKIIGEIAEKDGAARETVWNKVKRGFFSGHMMHLREVERVFGPGALIVLAALDDKLPPGFSGDEDQQLAMRFFTTIDGKEKEEIAERLLAGREKDFRLYRRRLKLWHKRHADVAKTKPS